MTPILLMTPRASRIALFPPLHKETDEPHGKKKQCGGRWNNSDYQLRIKRMTVERIRAGTTKKSGSYRWDERVRYSEIID